MSAVTLVDVARKAGVSQATASRVLNGSSRVPGADIARRVRAAARELGYVPNAQAQSLARAETGLLGLVVHDIADPYFSSIASGVQSVAQTASVQVLLASTGRDPEQEMRAIDAFVAHRTEAIVLVGSRGTSAQATEVERTVKRYIASGVRMTVVGQQLTGCHAILPRNAELAADLAEALIRQGHRRFAVLSGPPELRTASERTDGFIAALERHRLSPALVVPGEFTRDGGFAAANELYGRGVIGQRERICAFAVNDVMALGAIAAWRAHGVSVPGDVFIAGFDDIPTLRDYTPGLTTVRLPLEDMGRQAAILALTVRSGAPRTVPIAGEVVLRESTDLDSSPNGLPSTARRPRNRAASR